MNPYHIHGQQPPPNPLGSQRPFPPQGGPSQLAPRASGMAKASLALGLVSLPLVFLCIGWLTSILAIVFGFIGLSAIAKGDGRIRGKGLAWTGIISGFVALGGYGAFIAWTVKNNVDRPANVIAAEKAAAETEGMLSAGSSKEAARGETELEREIAQAFVDTFSTMHAAFIVREDAKEGEDAEVKGSFTAVCDISDRGCVILARVPEYKQHTADAKETVASMAWIAANGAVEDHTDELPAGSPLLVGLKGMALYGAIMVGSVGGEEPDTTDTERSMLDDFYLEDDATEPEGGETGESDDVGEP